MHTPGRALMQIRKDTGRFMHPYDTPKLKESSALLPVPKVFNMSCKICYPIVSEACFKSMKMTEQALDCANHLFRSFAKVSNMRRRDRKAI